MGDVAEHLVRDGARFLERTLDIGFGEIVADIEQAAGMFLGHLVGEAIAEIETGRVDAAPPLLIGLPNTPRRGGRDRDDVAFELFNQL